MNKKTSRIPSLDLLRIYGVLGVLGIHLFYPVFSRPDFLGGKSWWIANILHSLSLTSVPLLIMISGYLLVGRPSTIKANLKRTWKRLVLPLIVWSIWYFFWNYKYNFGEYDFFTIVEMIFSGSLFHLYFLVILIGLYLLLPIINQLVFTATKKEQKYGYMLAWSAGIIMSTVYYLNLVKGPVMSLFTWWLPYLGYFLTGYVIKKSTLQINTKKLTAMLVTWYIFTLLVSYEGVQMIKWNLYWFWHSTGTYYLNTFLSPNVIIMSVGTFILIVRGNLLRRIEQSQKAVKVLKYISSLTYGVYLIHFSVMDWIDIRHGFAIEFVTTSLRHFVVERTVMVVTISFFLAALLRAIPGLKIIVGESYSKRKANQTPQ